MKPVAQILEVTLTVNPFLTVECFLSNKKSTEKLDAQFLHFGIKTFANQT